MEVTFKLSISGKTKYWGVQDGEVFLQTSTKKAAVVLLNHLLKLKENYDGTVSKLQSDLPNDLLSEQVDSSPTSSSSSSNDGLRTDDKLGCTPPTEEQLDQGLRDWLEARDRANEARAAAMEARENTNRIILEIASDYSRLVDSTAKASLRSSSTGARSLEPETIDVDVVKQ